MKDTKKDDEKTLIDQSFETITAGSYTMKEKLLVYGNDKTGYRIEKNSDTDKVMYHRYCPDIRSFEVNGQVNVRFSPGKGNSDIIIYNKSQQSNTENSKNGKITRIELRLRGKEEVNEIKTAYQEKDTSELLRTLVVKIVSFFNLWASSVKERVKNTTRSQTIMYIK